MTIPTYEKSITITVVSHYPLVRGGKFYKVLDRAIESYSHTISAESGFETCDISMNVSETEADEWIANGLGRHIVCYGAEGNIVWEGYVDSVSVQLGGLTIERGKLSEICNRCSVEYTPIIGYDEETGEPITGTPTTTIIAEDLESQEKYGIWEQVIAGGTVEATEAEYRRDTYLEDNKEPEITHQPSIRPGSNSGDIKLSLNCKGYIYWLDNYVYEFGDYDLSIEASDKIKAVLSADPNGVISTDQNLITYNGVLVNAFENTSRMALEVINDAVSVGDINDNRWIFGIYENRRAVYKAIPTTIEYLHYIGTSGQKIEDINNTEVYPWNVRPGKFAIIPDVLIGRLPLYTQLRKDQRISFIEQITYTAPYGLDVQCKKIRNLDQYLAKLGV